MHGSYGLVWMVKDLAFPDSSWPAPRPPSPLASTSSSACWSGYWAFGWLLISGTSKPGLPAAGLRPGFSLCISLCILGSVIMIAGGRPEVLHAPRQARADHRRHVPLHPPSETTSAKMIIYGSFALMVFGTGCRSSCWAGRLDRSVRGQHDQQGGQHVAVPGVGRVQATHVVAAAPGRLGSRGPPAVTGSLVFHRDRAIA